MDNEKYHTSDLSFAALLFCNSKVEFLGLSELSKGVWEFNFRPYLLSKELELRFLAGKERVNALKYSMSIRRCKDLVFAVKRQAAQV